MPWTTLACNCSTVGTSARRTPAAAVAAAAHAQGGGGEGTSSADRAAAPAHRTAVRPGTAECTAAAAADDFGTCAAAVAADSPAPAETALGLDVDGFTINAGRWNDVLQLQFNINSKIWNIFWHNVFF